MADFVSKLQIALKEANETGYWLELFVKAEISDKGTVKALYNQCGTIRRILISSINTAKVIFNICIYQQSTIFRHRLLFAQNSYT